VFSIFKPLSVAVLISGGALSPASAAIVYSNYFTGGPVGSPGYVTEGTGSTFDGFTVSSGSVDLIGSYWRAPIAPIATAGSVDLDGTSPGAITLTTNVTLAAGTYALDFYLSGNPDGLPTTKQVDVGVGGVSQDFTYTLNGNTHTDMKYVLEQVDFTTTGGVLPLSFMSLDSNSPYGPVIGSLTISAIPETSTWAMMLLGFLGVGFLAYRRNGNRSFRIA
jgi:choice-of-anchor C domain-containing protein